MVEVAQDRRRWFQFGLATLLVGIVALAILLGFIRNRFGNESALIVSSQPLPVVLNHLGRHHKFKWHFDAPAISAAGIKPDSIIITTTMPMQPLRDTLQQLLEPHGLTCQMESGELVVTAQHRNP